MVRLPKVGILALKEIRLNRKKGQDQEQETGKRKTTKMTKEQNKWRKEKKSDL